MPGRTPLSRIFLAALLVLPAASLFGVQINGAFRLENIGFAPDRSSTDTTFTGADLFWGGSVSVMQPITDSFLVEGGVTRDLILGNTAYSLFQVRTDYFGLGIGTFLGFLNSPSASLKPGLTTYARLELPGIAYLSVRADGLPSGGTGGSGDYTQEQNEVALGLYLHNALMGIGVTYKRFVLSTAGGGTSDSLTDYWLRSEIFEKNIPLRLRLSLSYQTIVREYVDGATNPTDALSSFVLGTGFGVEVLPGLVMYIDLESSLFSSGSGQLSAVSVIGFEKFLFRATAGFTLNINAPAPPP
jgi:hypothetical protein